MADNTPNYQFRRKISDVKGIVNDLEGNPKKIKSFVESLTNIRSFKDLFFQTNTTIGIGNRESLYSISLKALQKGASVPSSRYYAYLFPSDLVRALTVLANIFSSKDSRLVQYAKGDFVLVKRWGEVDISGHQTIDEVAFLKHLDEIENLAKSIISAYRANQGIFDENNEEQLKKLVEAVEKLDDEDVNNNAEGAGGDDGSADSADEIDTSSQDSDTQPDDQQQTQPRQAQSSVVPGAAVLAGAGAAAVGVEGGGFTTSYGQEVVSPTPIPGALTADQKRRVQYEAAWMYNRAIYEMFTSYGIDRGSIDAQLLETLRTDIFKFTLNQNGHGIDEADLGKMFGSASKRQAALLKFYPQFAANYANQIGQEYQKAIDGGVFNDLSPTQISEFETFQNFLGGKVQLDALTTPAERLENAIENIIGSDSPVLNKNIQNTLDAMIIQYGANQELLIQSEGDQVSVINAEAGGHDVVDIINGMSPQKLALVFGIPDVSKLSTQDINKLKKVLENYVDERVSELTLHIQDTSLARGVMNVNDEELRKLHRNDPATSVRHLEFTTDTRKAVEENGAETIAGGTEDKRSSSRRSKIDKLKKEYKTFLPLWNDLQPREQRIVYSRFNLPWDTNQNKDNKLEFIPEFLFFDIAILKDLKSVSGSEEWLRNFNAVAQDQYLREHSAVGSGGPSKSSTQSQQQARAEAIAYYEERLTEAVKADKEEYARRVQEYQEYIEISQQLVLEEEYRRYALASYIYQTEQQDAIILANYLSAGLIAAHNFTPEYFENFSPRELMEAEIYIQENGHEMIEGGGGFGRRVRRPAGIRSRISNRIKETKAYKRARKRFKRFARKKLDPRKKLQNTFQNSAKSATVKAVNAALSSTGVGTFLAGANTVASKIGYKRLIKWGGTATALIVGKTIYALTTVGGAIGGAVGGAIGFIIGGGPVGILPGTIAGANFGQSILPANWFDTMFGGGQTTTVASAPTTTATSAATTQTATTSAATTTGATQATAAQAIASGSGTFFGISIAYLAPGLAMFIGIGVTLYTIFTIHSAFLIPIPAPYRDTRTRDANLPDGLVLCWPTTGNISQVPTASHLGIFKVGGVTQAFDIAWDEVVPFPPAVYTSHNGTVTVLDNGTEGYGLHVRVKSPDGYESIYAHLSAVRGGLQTGDTIGRGDLIGYMGSTGNSSGPHLHYEFYPNEIRDVVPNGANIQVDDHVEENCSTGGNQKGLGFIAIGSASGGNVVASNSNEINSGPVLTCNWRTGKGLTAAVNANFFNENGMPVGLAGFGSGDVKYWEDSTRSSAQSQLRALVLPGPSMKSVSSSSTGSGLSLAVTGIWSDSESGSARSNRTILGIGTPSSECNGEAVTVTGTAIFLGVIPSASYGEAEEMLKACGATQLVHMDGGGSSAFCSDEGTFSTTRAVPVNIGLKNAQIFQPATNNN